MLIATVGQTPDPVLVSLMEHTPDGVILIASQDSHPTAAAVLAEFKHELKHHTLLIEDPESLIESYQTALKALKKAKEWEARVILAEITAGTKPMIAGLALALTGQGVTFSYVGGTRRDETGRVISGHEKIRLLEDPTTRYYTQEWSAFRQAWNAGRMLEAQAWLERILSRPLTPSEERFHRHLLGITRGMDAWDRFQHAEALERFRAHLEPALAIAEAWHHGAKVRVLTALEEAQAFLERIVQARGKPVPELLQDLLANAERRAQAGRYDDALARLYRAVELAAEVDLYERHGLRIREPDSWPAGVPDYLRERARGMLGLKEVLDLAFDLSLHYGASGTRAQVLRGDYNSKLHPLLRRRHESILAHGTRPVTREDYEKMRDYLHNLGLEPAPEWPRW